MVGLAAVVFASGCTTINNQTSISTKTYSANGIFFNYPDNWQLMASSTPNAIASVGDPKTSDSSTKNVNTFVVIQKKAVPSGTTLKQAYDNTYAQFASTDSSFQQISDSTTTVDGTTAYVNTHKVDVSGVQKQEKAVWFEKDGNIYVILCGALPSDFNSEQENFDAIINTFEVT